MVCFVFGAGYSVANGLQVGRLSKARESELPGHCEMMRQ